MLKGIPDFGSIPLAQTIGFQVGAFGFPLKGADSSISLVNRLAVPLVMFIGTGTVRPCRSVLVPVRLGAVLVIFWFVAVGAGAGVGSAIGENVFIPFSTGSCAGVGSGAGAVVVVVVVVCCGENLSVLRILLVLVVSSFGSSPNKYILFALYSQCQSDQGNA